MSLLEKISKSMTDEKNAKCETIASVVMRAEASNYLDDSSSRA